MGSIVKNGLFILLVCLSIYSCSIFERGYTDHNGQYVPKRPNFKLKDKQGNITKNIDTNAVYKMVEMYNDGKLIYPKNNFTGDERYSWTYEINQVEVYIKFYSEGRCLSFSIPVIDPFGNPNKLKESDLNPNTIHYSKNYYYSSDGMNIQVESFFWNQGQGNYLIRNYVLDETRDILIDEDKYTKKIYKREPLPSDWNRYPVDW